MTFMLSVTLMMMLGVGFDVDYINEIEKRNVASVSQLDLSNGVSALPRFFASLDDYIEDKVPFRGTVISGKNYFDLTFGGRKDFDTVVVGNDGWLFLRDNLGERISGEGRVRAFLNKLKRFIDYNENQGRRVLVVVAPSKHVLYPKFLLDGKSKSRELLYEESIAFHDHLQSFGRKEVPSMLRVLEDRKNERTPLLYFPADTHHSYYGSIVMGEVIVNSFHEGLWDDALLTTVLAEEKNDLYRLIGVRKESSKINMYRVVREGVVVEATSFNLNGNKRDRIYVYKAKSDNGAYLIPGKTIVVCDSFVRAFLMSNLSPYFEEIHFCHRKSITNENWPTLFSDYDNVVVEVVSRSAIVFFNNRIY